mmetsp:Transcript_33977/g.97881  ORF Transcript_33977/g.97881 Transcript_33977/m.97881 type:complete len:86 (-) Transcript_33977:161-418(-)
MCVCKWASDVHTAHKKIHGNDQRALTRSTPMWSGPFLMYPPPSPTGIMNARISAPPTAIPPSLHLPSPRAQMQCMHIHTDRQTYR